MRAGTCGLCDGVVLERGCGRSRASRLFTVVGRGHSAMESFKKSVPLVVMVAGYVALWLSQAYRNFFVTDQARTLRNAFLHRILAQPRTPDGGVDPVCGCFRVNKVLVRRVGLEKAIAVLLCICAAIAPAILVSHLLEPYSEPEYVLPFDRGVRVDRNPVRNWVWPVRVRPGAACLCASAAWLYRIERLQHLAEACS